MNILLIDTVLDKTYLTLKTDKAINSLVLLSSEKDYHTSHVHSNLINLCEAQNLKIKDINMIVTDVGPGSFTGIKVGLTIVRTLSQWLNIKVVPVNSLEILIEAYRTDIALLDARKGKCYFFNKKEKSSPLLLDWDEVLAYKDFSFIADKKMYEFLAQNGICSINYEEGNKILSESMLHFIDLKEGVNWANLKPLYIQPPPIHHYCPNKNNVNKVNLL